MVNTEKYIIEDKNNYTVNFGKFTSKVFNKHSKKYGEKSATKTRDNVRKMYVAAMKQMNDRLKNNNLLLIGKVQSGKTSNLEMFTAIAFDNGYNCVIIYGGYDNKLLDQTCTRFRKTFDIDEQEASFDVPELFSTNDGNSVDALDDTVMETLIESGKPLIFVSMKRPRALERVNSIISNFNKNSIKAFIIDDEGDQASLNTEFKKQKESRTYQQILNMKQNLHNPLYLSVTATPQANVLKVKNKEDYFYFVFPLKNKETFIITLSIFSQEIQICLNSTLAISKNGELICEENVDNLKYSHFEIFGNICLIHFVGIRNYVVALNNGEILFSSYYDECKIEEKEQTFMCKLNDSLNHGKVFEIKNGKLEKYLIYLDNYELNLKYNFVGCVFLDCVKTGNFKYCNHLLNQELKLDNETEIKNFFPQFDSFYPIEENTFVLINKNTLAGIFEFLIEDLQISNIKSR